MASRGSKLRSSQRCKHRAGCNAARV